MSLKEMFIRTLGENAKLQPPEQDLAFKPRPGYEELHAFLIDKKTEAHPKPQR